MDAKTKELLQKLRKVRYSIASKTLSIDGDYARALLAETAHVQAAITGILQEELLIRQLNELEDGKQPEQGGKCSWKFSEDN
ncbi:MAG: hypothetical protein PHV82_14030 [Victivallaceae bacterium]|nr:hypothetical protein [Victivallaceae bacterium]